MGLRITVTSTSAPGTTRVLLDSPSPMARNDFTLNNQRVPDVVDRAFGEFVAVFDRGARRNEITFQVHRSTRDDGAKFTDEPDAIAYLVDHTEDVPAKCNVELRITGRRHTMVRYLAGAMVSGIQSPRMIDGLLTVHYAIVGGAFLKTKPA